MESQQVYIDRRELLSNANADEVRYVALMLELFRAHRRRQLLELDIAKASTEIDRLEAAKREFLTATHPRFLEPTSPPVQT
jgi:hypothetical protein